MKLQTVARMVGAGVILIGGMIAAHAAAQTPPSRTVTLVNVEASGAKIWLPSAVVLRPGQPVTLRLENKLDAPHGFAIDEYGIHVVVPANGTQEVTLTPKRGAARFYCQLHPAHVGGDMIVM